MSVSRGRDLLSGLALSAAAVAAVLLAGEVVLRAAGYVPQRFQNTARLVDGRWQMLLDCYPSNPRGYFEIDLRTRASRERYFHLAPHRFDLVARRAPFAVTPMPGTSTTTSSSPLTSSAGRPSRRRVAGWMRAQRQ